MNICIVILAAGQGTRMCSHKPKVLHTLGGKTLLEHVHATAAQLTSANIHVVYGYGGDQVLRQLMHLEVNWVEQIQQLGTGHAVAQVVPYLPAESEYVLILYGDVPLISAETLRQLLTVAETSKFALLTMDVAEPHGYGRIVRSAQGQIRRIVEQKDADLQERAIREVNTGIMAVATADLIRWIAKLTNRNAQQEYYLTDIVEMAAVEGISIATVAPTSSYEVAGVNDRKQLAELERYYQCQQIERLMLNGVTVVDPARVDIRGKVENDKDVTIDINVILAGRVKLGKNVVIGPNTYIRDADIGDDVEIQSNCVIEDAVIGAGTKLGPFSRIRPGTILAEDVHVGNFVEIKNSKVAQGSKINHLSYIGDTDMGSRVNIGAGTITCNYDGANKFRTTIGDDVFIGSDCQLVAPVKLGDGATIAAGTTVSQDAPPGLLTIGRARQTVVHHWKRPQKKKS